MTSARTQSSHGAKVVPNVTDDEIAHVEEGSLRSSTRIEMTDANRLFLEKYRALDLAGQFEQSFPTFSDASIGKEYRKFNQHSVSLIPCLLLSITIVSLLLSTRYNFPFMGSYEDPFTVCAQASVIPGFIAFTLYLVSQFYLLHYKRNSAAFSTYSKADRDVILLRKKWCDKCLEYPLEDIMCIGLTTSHALIFLGRVHMGQCPDNVSIWEAQRCNPVASSNSFPTDDVISFFVAPVIYTAFSRGVSLYGNLISYAVAAAAILYAMVLVNGGLQGYTALWIFVYFTVTLELERWMRVSFVRHKLLVDSRRTAIAAAENETKQVVFSALAAQTAAEDAAKILDLNNKAHLAAKEQEMLRLIMGNVAHDMKTPLHSIFAELESVRDAVNEACTEAAVPGAVASVVLGRLKSSTDGTLDVVDSMTQFLVMSINRSQDYAKLTSNIALKPTLETVSVPDVLRFVTKCMAHQNSHRIINVHPLVSEFCYCFCLRLGYCYD
jgi:signal transduction histidine kinase